MWINTLESASVTLGSLAAIIGTFAALFKWLSRKITSVIEHELKRDLSEITRHTAQLIPNGGTHLADQITRLEISQAKTCTEIQAVAKAFTEHLADHRAK
jgi:hypothetical protein